MGRFTSEPDIPGNREVIKDNKNGFLVNVFDYKTFSDKILYLMETKKERARLSNHSENLSDWDADHMVETQEILYQSLIRSKIK